MPQVTNDMDRRKLYARALREYGPEAQKLMLIEEIGELLNAIAKLPRGRSIPEEVVEELADVSIMVEQMAFLFGWSRYTSERNRKLGRLASRLSARE